MKGNIKFYATWFLAFLVQATVLTLAFAIPFSYFTQTSFLYSFEWLHKEVLIPFLWYFGPAFTLYVIAVIVTLRKGLKVPVLEQSIHNKLFNRGVFFVFASIIVGAASQVAGGCIWQLPVILAGWHGYYWRRFGYEILPEPVLFVGYFIITATYVYLLISYFNLVNKHLNGHKVQQNALNS